MTTEAKIPKKTLGPIAFIALAVVVVGLLGWMLGTAFINPEMSIEQLLRVG